jgi:hypothetical protein
VHYDDEPHLYEIDHRAESEEQARRARRAAEQAHRERARALKKSPRARWSVSAEESRIVLRMEKGDPTVITESWPLGETEARDLRDALDAELREEEASTP